MQTCQDFHQTRAGSIAASSSTQSGFMAVHVTVFCGAIQPISSHTKNRITLLVRRKTWWLPDARTRRNLPIAFEPPNRPSGSNRAWMDSRAEALAIRAAPLDNPIQPLSSPRTASKMLQKTLRCARARRGLSVAFDSPLFVPWGFK